MDERLIQAAIAVVGVPIVLVGYIVFAELLIRPAGPTTQRTVRPWLWLGPGLAFLVAFWGYPTLSTIYSSFLNNTGERFVGLANYSFIFSDATMLGAVRNNLLWLIVFTALTVGFGMLIAVLAD